MNQDPITLWHATTPASQALPALSGATEADLLVIGGGFAGLSTALHAAKAGLSVVQLEAHRIAWGASGRNAGFVVPNFAKVDPDGIRAALGVDGAKLIAMAAGSSDLVFDLIRHHGIDCDALQAGWIQPSHCDTAVTKAQAQVRQWSALQRPVELLDAARVAELTGVQSWRGGWIDLSGGVLNPVAYAHGLARAATQSGARLFENSQVTGMKRKGQDWLAITSAGTVQARRVVMATNAYGGLLWPSLARSFIPLRVFQIATAPLPLSVRTRLLPGGQSVSDSRRNLFTFRFDAQNRLISGGMHILSLGAGARLPRVIHRRMARILGLPDLPPLAFAWSGMASVMPDYLPRLVELGPNLIAGFACNGRGIAMSTAMGKELADWAAGKALRALALPVRPATKIPFHAVARLAPNALLPVSLCRDHMDRWCQTDTIPTQ
jgi:glycine/D-amino acid oxidase-like deaminating enzyme